MRTQKDTGTGGQPLWSLVRRRSSRFCQTPVFIFLFFGVQFFICNKSVKFITKALNTENAEDVTLTDIKQLSLATTKQGFPKESIYKIDTAQL